eukprot:TRINITY_DN7527_c0_g1_i2.p1 TRINITY_DN7527_c0_g1~~TRINITY_DN7527_c0_g1_i2.p1  ORF type:complete len:354 (+),score=37.13 TRINITY_DN7527_c0_g1_i2:107-1168(+)
MQFNGRIRLFQSTLVCWSSKNWMYIGLEILDKWLSSGQTLGVKAQRFRGHTSPHRNVKEKQTTHRVPNHNFLQFIWASSYLFLKVAQQFYSTRQLFRSFNCSQFTTTMSASLLKTGQPCLSRSTSQKKIQISHVANRSLKTRQGTKSFVVTGVSSPAFESQRTSQYRQQLKNEGEESGTVSTPWWKRNQPSNMVDANSVQDLVDILAASGDKLVIVDFFATWCNACKALFPKLVKICNDNSDTIIVVKVNWEENKAIAKPLGIKVLPYFHFYRGVQGRVAAFSATVSKMHRLRDAIDEHVTPRCFLEPLVEPILQEFPEVHPVQNLEVSGNVVSFPVTDGDNKNQEEQSMVIT